MSAGSAVEKNFARQDFKVLDQDLDQARRLYIDLIKRTVANVIYQDPRRAPETTAAYDHSLRETGSDWPILAHTMIGLKRLDNLQSCVEQAIADEIPGDLLEAGVWRGGATILMRAILKAYNDTARRVWVTDSFEGLPPPDAATYPEDAGDPHHTYEFLKISLDQVQEHFRRYGLLDDQVRFLKGWFKDTLPQAPIESLAVLRLDGDMYGSTMEALTYLYPKLSPGGFLIVDDYGAIPACKKAIHDYRAAQRIGEQIQEIDWTGVYWRKE